MAIQIESRPTTFIPIEPDLLEAAREQGGIAAGHMFIPTGTILQPVEGMGIVIFPIPQGSEFDSHPVAIYATDKWQRPEMIELTEDSRRAPFRFRIYGTRAVITSRKVA